MWVALKKAVYAFSEEDGDNVEVGQNLVGPPRAVMTA